MEDMSETERKEKNGNEDLKITADGLRNSLYEQYRHEIDAIWRNSRFIWTFEAVLFGAYGIVVLRLLDKQICIDIAWVLVVFFLITLGLCTSAIWIAIAKASKTWQEWYEGRITSLEANREMFVFPVEYAMGGTTHKIEGIDTSLRSMEAGKFSAGRINIFIAQFVWIVWGVLFVIHQIQVLINFHFLPESFSPAIMVTIVYAVFLKSFKNRTENGYIIDEDYKGEFILKIYMKLDRCIAELKKLKSDCKNMEESEDQDVKIKVRFLLYDFITNYCGDLSFNLFRIWKAQGECRSYEHWQEEPLEKTKEAFFRSCIADNVETRKYFGLIDEMLKEFDRQKKHLRGFYYV